MHINAGERAINKYEYNWHARHRYNDGVVTRRAPTCARYKYADVSTVRVKHHQHIIIIAHARVAKAAAAAAAHVLADWLACERVT